MFNEHTHADVALSMCASSMNAITPNPPTPTHENVAFYMYGFPSVSINMDSNYQPQLASWISEPSTLVPHIFKNNEYT